MKRLCFSLSLIFTFCFVMIVSISNSYSQTILPSNENITYGGRCVVTDSVASYLYPGTTISTIFRGTSIQAVFNNTLAYYMVQIDDNQPFKVCTKTNETSNKTIISLAEKLADENHFVVITLVSEGIYHNPQFLGFIVLQGVTLSKVTAKPHKFEFIGNSITCGYGTEVTDCSPYNDSTSNFCQAYAYLTAQACDANYMTVARSGIGIYRNYGDKETASAYGCMPDNYEKIWLENDVRWDFSLFTPDLLFINLGTNDTWDMTSFNAVKFEENYRILLQKVLSHYPKTKVLLLTGSMMNQEALAAVKPILNKLQKEFSTKRHPIYRFDFTPQNGKGADYHPCAAQQKLMSEELIPFVKEILGK